MTFIAFILQFLTIALIAILLIVLKFYFFLSNSIYYFLIKYLDVIFKYGGKNLQI